MISIERGGEPVDPLDLELGFARGHSDRPWLMANFVTTIDGAAVVSGGSSAINDDDDRALFQALRAVPDVILIGAGTLRAEDYGPVTLSEERRARRIERHLAPTPQLVVVSGSLSIDPSARVFSDPGNRVEILTTTSPESESFARLSEVADVVQLDELDAASVIGHLGYAGLILCEGGPSLMGQFVAAGLVDELAWSISPVLAAGESPRMAHGPPSQPLLEMRLDRVFYGDRMVFTRWLRR